MLKLNAGVSKKISDNNFGSRGASVNLEIELESAVVQDPDGLQDRIRQLFRLAQQSVNEELQRPDTDVPAAQGQPSPNGNGRHNGNGNGQTAPRRSNGRRATASQARALRAIADRQGLNLATELQNRFGIDRPEDLGIGEASQLIDDLKSLTNGNGRR
jgi:hypothetical protein